MTNNVPKHLDVTTDIEALDALIKLDGLKLVDVGCGVGDLARALVDRGAQVIGIEPDPTQAALNTAADPVPGLTFFEAPAQSMPIDSGTMDGVIFSRSLHHVPGAEMDAALLEAERILKPESGFMFVLEPEVSGAYYELMKPFHDETKVRSLARAALVRVADRDFSTCETYMYETLAVYDAFEAFRDRVVARSYLDIDEKNVDTTQIRQTFETGYDGAAYRFAAPHWIGLYRGVAARS